MKKLAIILALLLALASTIGIFCPAASLNTQAQVYARGGTKIQTITERIDYDYKVVDQYILNPKLPGYCSDYSCGITAGGVTIAWFNKAYPSLIPNHVAGTTFLGQWLWATQNSAIENVYDSLYAYMNATDQGVTINGYLGGLKTYVTKQGLTFTSENTMGTNGILNNKYKTALQNGKLLSIFVDGFNLTMGPESYTGYDTLNTEVYTGAHLMAVYGYTEVSYYNSDNIMFRKDSFLSVNSGFSGSLRMIRLNNYITIDDCYIININ